jgi:hypothetical protein
MLDTPEEDGEHIPQQQHKRSRRPGYFDKQLRAADAKRRAAEERVADIVARREEKDRRVADRQRFRKAMGHARRGGGVGGRGGAQRKLGRESELLLEKVKKLVGKT